MVNQCHLVQTLEKRIYFISVDAKTKKIAYESLKEQERKILVIVNLYHLIPNNNSLLISKIKSKYISRTKMWHFYQTFAIYGTKNELSAITKLF